MGQYDMIFVEMMMKEEHETDNDDIDNDDGKS